MTDQAITTTAQNEDCPLCGTETLIGYVQGNLIRVDAEPATAGLTPCCAADGAPNSPGDTGPIYELHQCHTRAGTTEVTA